jgi:hypothetical protein
LDKCSWEKPFRNRLVGFEKNCECGKLILYMGKFCEGTSPIGLQLAGFGKNYECGKLILLMRKVHEGKKIDRIAGCGFQEEP